MRPPARRSSRLRARRVVALPFLIGAGLLASCQLDELLKSPAPGTGPESTNTTSAVRLSFLVQPASTTQGATLSPAIRVAALDQSGNPVPTFGGTISLSIAQNPGDASLQGTTTRPASQGVAEFSDLRISQAGTGYRLAASGNDLASATSGSFNIMGRLPDDIVEISGNDQTDTVGATLRDPYVVRVVDEDGEPLSGIQVGWSTGPNGGSVNPATAVTGADGEAHTFHTLGMVAGEYSATAWIGQLPGTGVTFQSRARAGRATQLIFTQEPGSTERNDRFEPPVVVTALDQFGNTATEFSSTVTMSIVPGTGTPGGRLEGDRTRAAANGVATFPDLRIPDAGLGYRLRATAPGNLQKDSAPFHIWLTIGDDDDEDDGLLGPLLHIDLLGTHNGAGR